MTRLDHMRRHLDNARRRLKRRWPSASAALAVGATLALAAGQTGIVDGSTGIAATVVVLAAWVALPALFGVAVAAVTASAVLLPAAPTLAIVAVALLVLGVLVEFVDRRWTRGQWAVLGAAILTAGVVATVAVRSGDDTAMVALGVLLGTSTLMYVLHRYTLVQTEVVADGD